MKILFLCTGNSCRSQMAEGYAKHLGGDFLNVKSAGLVAYGVNPRAIQIMKEDGVDMSQQKSTQLTADMFNWADLIITLCGHADEHCPVIPSGKEKRYIPFEDPAKTTGSEEQILNQFRQVRDQIKKSVETLVEEFKPKHESKLKV